MRALIAGYRLLQRLVLPPSFRRVFGDEMDLVFATRLRRRWEEGGRVAAGLTSLREGFDLLVTATREWRSITRRSRWSTRTLFPSDGAPAGGPFGRGREPLGSAAAEVYRILRCWKQRPGFAVATILTLGLAIGANTAVFSVVNAVLLKPIPFHEPDRLVTTQHTALGVGIEEMLHTDALYFLYSEHTRVFEEFGLFLLQAGNLTGGEYPERVPILFVTRSALNALAVAPILGRSLTEQDEEPSSPPVTLLTYDTWRRRFGADSSIVGQILRLDGIPREIVGVMPRGFQFPTATAELLLPFQFDRSNPAAGDYNYYGIARMAQGVTPREAERDMDRVAVLLPELHDVPTGLLEDTQLRARVVPLKAAVVGDAGRVLWTLLGTVGFVFLIACANVANLCLVRMDGRRQEMAMRITMGARRSDLARHFFLESLLLGLVGGSAGFALAYAGVKGLVALSPPSIPRMEGIGMDATVLGFALGIALLATLLFGLSPLAQARAFQLASTLKEGSQPVRRGSRRYRLQDLLAVTQTALALILTVGAALMVQTVRELRSVDPGFDDPGSVLTLQVSLPEDQYVYDDYRYVPEFHRRLVERIRELPGIISVGGVTALPLTGQPPGFATDLQNSSLEPDRLPEMMPSVWVTEGYFEAMGIDVVTGRPLVDSDLLDRTGAVVINQSLARRLWEDSNPLGKGLRPSRGEQWYRVVGVVSDVHHMGVDQQPTDVVYYPPVGLGSDTTRFAWASRRMTYAVRTDGDPLDVAPAIREAIWSMDPDLPIARIRTMDEILSRSMARASFCTLLLGISAVMALVMGIVGVYGVVSYVVTQRTREMGVRIALGAGRRQLIRLVVGRGLALAAAGAGFGLLATGFITRLMENLLFGITPTDPETLAVAALVLTAVAVFASYLPARRVASIDPVDALAVE